MPVLHFTNFEGELPQINDRSLPQNNATVARNVKLWGRSLRPFRGLLGVQATDTTSPEAIFRYDSTKWLEWATDVDARRSPFPNDPYGRVYYTGDGVPKVTDSTLVGSTPPYPGDSYLMGVPPPAAAPTLVLGGSGSGTAETRYYVFTYVNGYDEEGPPSPVSASITVLPGETVQVTMGATPGDDRDYAYRRIYRSVTVGVNKVFQFVAEVSAGTTVYVDSVATADLGEVMTSTFYDPPPTDLAGLISVNGQFMAGFRGNEAWISEDGYVHAWPEDYRQAVDYQIVGLGELDNGFAIMTEGYPYLAIGLRPGSIKPTPVRSQMACVAKRGIVSFGRSVVYPSPRGLVELSSTGAARLLTDGIFDRSDWNALTPSSIRAYRWRNMYFALYESTNSGIGGFLIDPRAPERGVVFFDAFESGGGYVDLEEEALYVVHNGSIARWDSGAVWPLTWTSAPKELAAPASVRVARVFADSYPVQIAVYRDDKLQARVRVDSSRPRRLDNAALGRSYKLEVVSENEVSGVFLASNIKEFERA